MCLALPTPGRTLTVNQLTDMQWRFGGEGFLRHVMFASAEHVSPRAYLAWDLAACT